MWSLHFNSLALLVRLQWIEMASITQQNYRSSSDPAGWIQQRDDVIDEWSTKLAADIPCQKRTSLTATQQIQSTRLLNEGRTANSVAHKMSVRNTHVQVLKPRRPDWRFLTTADREKAISLLKNGRSICVVAAELGTAESQIQSLANRYLNYKNSASLEEASADKSRTTELPVSRNDGNHCKEKLQRNNMTLDDQLKAIEMIDKGRSLPSVGFKLGFGRTQMEFIKENRARLLLLAKVRELSEPACWSKSASDDEDDDSWATRTTIRQQIQLDIEARLKVIKLLDMGCSATLIATEMGVGRKQIHSIGRNKDQILQQAAAMNIDIERTQFHSVLQKKDNFLPQTVVGWSHETSGNENVLL